jgi:hypothetical protein
MTNVARTGQALLIVASSMLFAAFTSAMVVRRATGTDWMAPPVPAWLWAAAVLAVSASWLVTRRAYRSAALCGFALVASQITYAASLRMGDVAQSFAAVLVTAHAGHALFGACALWWNGERASLFWHFAGAIWLYVLWLIGVWA